MQSCCRTWLQSLHRMWATQQAYSSGMGVLATSSSTLRQIAARSAYDFMQIGHASCLHSVVYAFRDASQPARLPYTLNHAGGFIFLAARNATVQS